VSSYLATHPGRQAAWTTNFVVWCLVSVNPQCGTGLMSPFWRLDFWEGG